MSSMCISNSVGTAFPKGEKNFGFCNCLIIIFISTEVKNLDVVFFDI